MGTNVRPFIGFGFMLSRSDMDEKEFDTLYEDLIDKYGSDELWSQDLFYCKDLDVASDCYNGAWIFIGKWSHGDDEDIVKMPYGFMAGNGDDIDLELKRQLGEDHPFLKHATFGLYFGTDWT